MCVLSAMFGVTNQVLSCFIQLQRLPSIQYSLTLPPPPFFFVPLVIHPLPVKLIGAVNAAAKRVSGDGILGGTVRVVRGGRKGWRGETSYFEF